MDVQRIGDAMSKAHPQAMAFLVLVFLPLCSSAIADPQATNNCNKENAEKAREEFRLAMENRRQGKWQDARDAITHLKKAADLCPVPKNLIPPTAPAPFTPKYSYIPFYFLGSCHVSIEEPPDALRYLHLSSCFGEPKRDADATEDLESLTGGCLKQIVRQQRPDKQPPYFSEGVNAKQNKEWERSAERMWDSMQVWPEDGETTIIDGRWPEPYVPRFHLANALFELGCRQQACEQLALSKLKDLAAKDRSAKYDDERKEMEQLQAKCALSKKGAPENIWICQQWQCWLKRDRR